MENRIRDTFLKEFFQLTNLCQLLLSFNEITGTLPTTIGRFSNLQSLYLFSNILTGQILSEIRLLASVEIVTLAENAFHGTIPNQVNNMKALKSFLIHNGVSGKGKLTGPLTAFDNCPFLHESYLDGNDLTGTMLVVDADGWLVVDQAVGDPYAVKCL